MRGLLSIGALDTSGGAGLNRDGLACHLAGVWNYTVVSGLTIQTENGLSGFKAIEDTYFEKELEVIDNLDFTCVKIGALFSVKQAELAASSLAGYNVPLVWDPVIGPTRGKMFLQKDELRAMYALFKKLGVFITPNYNELLVLSGEEQELKNDSEDFITKTATDLALCSESKFYVTGGHGDTDVIKEWLIYAGQVRKYEFPRIKLSYSHGTGCHFSALFAIFLARYGDPFRAVRDAHQVLLYHLQSDYFPL